MVVMHAKVSPIASVRIRNFRCFSDFEGQLEPLTALVGANGTGKTAVLEALFYCLAPYTRAGRFSPQDFTSNQEDPIDIRVQFHRPFTAAVPDGYTQQKIEFDKVRLVVKPREKAGPGRALNDPFAIEHYVEPVEGEYGAGDKWKLKRKNGSDFKFTTRHLAMANVELSDYPTVQYFSKTCERQAAGGYNSTFQRILDEFSWRYRKGSSGRSDEVKDAWNQYHDLVLGAIDDKKRKAFLGSFRDAAAELLGIDCQDVEFSLLRLQEPFAKGFLARRMGLSQIDLGGMGSGIAMLMTLALLETIAEVDDSDLVILIDEPEMHLHPQLQKRIKEHLAAQCHQIVYTTHSPIMVDLRMWKSVRRFDYDFKVHPTKSVLKSTIGTEKDAKRVEQHMEEIEEYKQYVATLMQDNNELLFAQSCVLVEGPVDKYAIKTIASVLDKDIEYLTIIPCHGKNKVPYYQLLCRAFAVPYFVVIDRDESKGEDNSRVYSFAEDDRIFGFEESLEAEFGICGGKKKAPRAIAVVDECAENGHVPGAMKKLLNLLETFNAQAAQGQQAGSAFGQ